MRRKRFLTLAYAAATAACPLLAHAGAIWTGNVSTFWSISGNWDTNNVPGDQVNEDATVNSGTPTVDSNFSLRDFTLTGGQLHGVSGNSLDVGRTFSWSGGTVAADALVNVTGSVSFSNSLHNDGTVLVDASTGAINVASGTVFDNTGTVSVANGLFTLRAGTNSGRLDAGSNGTILFQTVGPYTLAAGSSLSGSGTFVITTGVDLQTTVSLQNLQHSGVITGGTFTTTGDFDWQGGEMKSGGQTNIASTSTMHISGSGIKNLQSRNLISNGTINWSGSGEVRLQDGAILQNNNRFLITNDAVMDSPSAVTGQVSNAGSLTKSGGLGTTAIFVPMNNTGTIGVTSGNLKLAGGGTGGGTWSIGSGSTLTFAGDSSAAYVLANTATLTNSGALVNASFLKAPAALLAGNGLVMDATTADELFIDGDLPVSEITWNRGVISGPGNSTMAGKTFNSAWGVGGGRDLKNSGIITWAAGASWGLGTDHISIFDNDTPGTIDNQAGAQFNFNADGDLGLFQKPSILIVNNDGSFTVSASKTVNVYGAMNNTATVSVGNGATLSLNYGGSDSGSFLIGESAQLAFAGPATHTLSSSVAINSAGNGASPHNLLFDAATTEFSGSVDSTIDLRAGADDLSTALLNINSGANVSARSFTVAGGTVQIKSGATVNAANFVMTGGVTSVDSGASVTVTNTTMSGAAQTFLRINNGATVHAGAFDMESGGVLWLDGGTLISTGTAQAHGAVIGNGEIDATLDGTAALFSPGVDFGNIGSTTITGGLSLDFSSAYLADIFADNHTNDLIHAETSATLGDAVLLVTVGGDLSQIAFSDQFVILTTLSLSGQFTVDMPDDSMVSAYDPELNNVLGQFEVVYDTDQGEVILTHFQPVPEPQFLWIAPALIGLARRRRFARTAAR